MIPEQYSPDINRIHPSWKRPIEVTIPQDLVLDSPNKYGDYRSLLRLIGVDLVNNGVELLAQNFINSKDNFTDIISQLNVLAVPDLGNLFPNRNDLLFNDGSYRNCPVLILKSTNSDMMSPEGLVQVAIPMPADVPRLISCLADVISDKETGLLRLVNNENDINLVATFAKIVLSRIHPFEDGNGRTSRALYKFIRIWLSSVKGIPINDDNWPETLEYTRDDDRIYSAEMKTYLELDLMDEMYTTYPNGLTDEYIRFHTNKSQMNELYIKGVNMVCQHVSSNLGKGIMQYHGIDSLDQLRKSPTLVKLSDPVTRHEFISSQT